MADDYAHLDAALPGFSRARLLVKAQGDKLSALGFVGTNKYDFDRFANRFRLAASFQGIALDGFTAETTAGYAALTRVFFSWSAFERYAELANDRPPFRSLFAHYPPRHIHALARTCRSLDPQQQLCDFLVSQSLLPVHETHLQRFRDGHDFSVLTLAASIRHIFAHGILTAHPNGLASASLAELGHSLADFLIEFVRADFARRLTLAEALAPPAAE
jgi:hypothetical protein